MSSKGFKHDLFSQFARVAKAMSHANRLELLEFLAQGERSVDALAKVSGLSVANTSQHLQQLKAEGKEVNIVALFDSYVYPHFSKTNPLIKKIYYMLYNISQVYK